MYYHHYILLTNWVWS